ncbi:MAG: class I SAM-dependent methyltransferase [Pseudomonadales bacterium]|nr:class I SAM-dependent methyltransferase [Pseudomonadales bacterium]
MDSQKFWDDTAERYAKSPMRDEQIHQEKLSKTQEHLDADSVVLELGCGTGTTALHHAPLVKQIVATDISNNMLDIARKKALEAGIENVEFKQATAEDLTDEPASYDAILALNLIHLLDDPVACIRKAYDLLKPGGVFVTSTVCLGDTLFSFWRILIPTMQLLGRAPSVQYMKRANLDQELANAGFQEVFARPAAKGEAAFIVSRKPS